MKIAFIGAGSTVFMKNIIGDVLQRPALAGATIALMDVNQERLDESAIVALKLAATLGVPAKVETHTDRRQATPLSVSRWSAGPGHTWYSRARWRSTRHWGRCSSCSRSGQVTCIAGTLWPSPSSYISSRSTSTADMHFLWPRRNASPIRSPGAISGGAWSGAARGCCRTRKRPAESTCKNRDL